MRVNKLTEQPPKAKKESQAMKITTIDDAVFQYAQTQKPTPTINKMIQEDAIICTGQKDNPLIFIPESMELLDYLLQTGLVVAENYSTLPPQGAYYRLDEQLANCILDFMRRKSKNFRN